MPMGRPRKGGPDAPLSKAKSPLDLAREARLNLLALVEDMETTPCCNINRWQVGQWVDTLSRVLADSRSENE
jgi:hypothetical protein